LSWKKFILGVGVGVTTALFVQSQLSKEYISAEKALKNVKEAFKQSGPIEGSWINTERESFDANGIIHDVYRGGVSKVTDGRLSHYEYVISAKTGTLIEVNEEE
jgi:predicted small secreted protein